MQSRGVKILTLSEGELGVAIDGDVVIVVTHDELAYGRRRVSEIEEAE